MYDYCINNPTYLNLSMTAHDRCSSDGMYLGKYLPKVENNLITKCNILPQFKISENESLNTEGTLCLYS